MVKAPLLHCATDAPASSSAAAPAGAPAQLRTKRAEHVTAAWEMSLVVEQKHAMSIPQASPQLDNVWLRFRDGVKNAQAKMKACTGS